MSSGYRDTFKGTAWYYARYRPPYPQPFLEHLVDRFALDGTGRLLDLGTGTGQLAIPLSSYFEEVVGMDPEPEMLTEAAVLASQFRASAPGATNIRWLEGGSGDLERLKSTLGQFRLVTMGASFHWMDQSATLQTLADLVTEDVDEGKVGRSRKPGETGERDERGRSGIVIVGSPSIWNQQGEWQEALKSVLQRWLGEARRAGSSAYVQPAEPFATVLARSPFNRVETYQLDYRRTWDIDSLIGYLYSMSFSSISLLGNRREPFEEDVRQTLLALNSLGQFTEMVALEAFLAWRT
jgi:SAM-dependent methyltransferase